MTKENWIKWLQVRIPILKDKANEFWLAQALDGFHKDEQSRQASVMQSHPLPDDSECIDIAFNFGYGCDPPKGNKRQEEVHDAAVWGLKKMRDIIKERQ